MTRRALPHRRPSPTLGTGLFGLAVAVTAASVTGLLPGVPKMLPTYMRLLMGRILLLAVAILALILSLVGL